MTTDHTMGNMGVQGDGAAMLSRAVGVWPRLPFDMMVSKPEPGDVYLVCSDGLSKMLASEEIRAVLGDASLSADAAVEKLVERANAAGGLDNITAIVIRVMTSDSKRMRVA
jgi:protein phosphatase